MGIKVFMTPTGKELQHPGSGMAYSSYKCRCDDCIAFNTLRNAERRAKRYEIGATGILPDGVKHGQSAATNWGCKCDICIQATKDKNRKWYDEHYERTGPKRGDDHPTAKLKELEVLAIHERLKLDENASQIAREYGVHQSAIYKIKTGKSWGWLTGRGK